MISLDKVYSESDYPKAVVYPHKQTLTVSDIERLAKAGVTMTFADVASQITSDVTPAPQTEYLADAIWRRWDLANRRPNVFGGDSSGDYIYTIQNGNPGRVSPFELYAVSGPSDDKVHIVVTPLATRQPIMMTDPKTLFPSDALITSLVLLLETQRGLTPP